MGLFVNPDCSAFKAAVASEIYIDKTSLIKHTNQMLGTLQAFVCNSRPRRFGKSVTADMLTAYYSKGADASELFQGLAISQIPGFTRHLNKYDVLHFDIQWCFKECGKAEATVPYITKIVLNELRQLYGKIVPDDVQKISGALSAINAATGNKFVIVIDEWDVFIRDESHNTKVQEQYIDFLRNLFKGSEPAKYVALAYLTGILPIKKVKTQSALNNFDEYTMLDASFFAPYTGFTENEVKTLCSRYHADFTAVKRWYDGYLLDDYHIYNPKAVVNAMLRGRLQSYWSQTGTYQTIKTLIDMNFAGLRTAIIDMLAGNSVAVNTNFFQNDMISFASKDDILTALIHLGYLSYDINEHAASIPNEEIRQEFAGAISSNNWSELHAFEIESTQLLNAVLDGETAVVANSIAKLHDEYASSIRYNDENSLSSVLTIAFLSTMQYYFKPIREFPTGRGFADFVYLPKPRYKENYPALIVELKWNQSAKTALEQIKKRNYTQALEQYTGNMLLVGINYDKKSKEHTCCIEQVKK